MKIKQTDIGVIPEDWEVRTLREVGDVQMCKRVFKEQTAISGDVPFFKIGTFGNEPDAFISQELYESYRQKYNYPQKGDILFSAAGTIGRTVIYNGKSAYFQDSNIVWINNNEKIVSNQYLYYFYKVVEWTTSDGGIVSRLYNEHIRNTQIYLPPTKQEQQAIAQTLSDIDSLIEALDKKIAKKRAIKEGTMQQLLTGKKRLAGFREPWVEVELKEDLYFQPGYPFQSSFFNAEQNGIRLIRNRDLKSNDQIIHYNGIELDTFVVKNGDLLVSMDGDFIPTFWTKGKALLNQRVGRVKSNGKWFLRYFYYALSKPLQMIQDSVGATTVKHLSHSDVENIVLTIPSTKKEQQAIAQILTDMDNEIEQLEKERQKYTVLKQGAMQQLLTGQIRLSIIKKTVLTKPKHNEQINEAVVISFLVYKFSTNDFPLSRFRYTKYAYLLHRQYENETKGFQKHVAGPYKSTNRYKGPENIAIKNKYIKKIENPKSGKDAFLINDNIEKSLTYFTEWYGINIQLWIEKFRYYKNEYLEVLTTVDESICDLNEQNKIISVNSIKEYIHSIPQWKDKLTMPYFNDFNIQKAINESNGLFGINT